MELNKKAEQRRIALEARKNLGEDKRQEYSSRICAELIKIFGNASGKTVFSYNAMKTEADPKMFDDSMRESGNRICYPVCRDNGEMDAYEESELIPSEEIDIVIVPCVGFDEKGNRLGHGGGYYDRYLPKCPNAKKVMIAFEAQKLESVETEPWDVKMDIVVTETSVAK